jgi:hypothetical protein
VHDSTKAVALLLNLSITEANKESADDESRGRDDAQLFVVHAGIQVT